MLSLILSVMLIEPANANVILQKKFDDSVQGCTRALGSKYRLTAKGLNTLVLENTEKKEIKLFRFPDKDTHKIPVSSTCTDFQTLDQLHELFISEARARMTEARKEVDIRKQNDPKDSFLTSSGLKNKDCELMFEMIQADSRGRTKSNFLDFRSRYLGSLSPWEVFDYDIKESLSNAHK